MWGDEGHRAGFCLYKMGCKGPATFQNCPNIGWNENTNWPIGCGHPCIGCAEPAFWDTMTPFYQHLKGVPGFDAATSIDRIGAYATAGVGVAFAGHGLVQIGKRAIDKRRAAKPAEPAAEPKKDGEP
jgi:hydrogenase small subunit